jgi:hypothetical protein
MSIDATRIAATNVVKSGAAVARRATAVIGGSADDRAAAILALGDAGQSYRAGALVLATTRRLQQRLIDQLA